MISVFLSDNHMLVRKGIRSLIESQADISVVGESRDGPETIKLVEQLKPDVLIVDLFLDGAYGLDVVGAVRCRAPATRSIMLTLVSEESCVKDAFRSGVSGYVLKDSPPGVLIEAIREVAAGGRFFS